MENNELHHFGYQFVKIIGAGQFGTVFKCIDANNNIRCIKEIKLVNTSKEIAVAHLQMIQREIYLLQNLQHPRIISLYGYFCTDDSRIIYIVMEYASFGSLSNMIARRHAQMDFLPEFKIKQFLIDMMLGIEFLYMKNVVHKDLKPCNILICNNERLKIADFGVSKIPVIENNNSMNIMMNKQVKESGGSPIYMAPETLIHNRFSFASDIWALGCILYELCTLSAAFGFVESMDELIRCTLTNTYEPIGSVSHRYSKQLLMLCNRMMDVDVQKRPTIKEIIVNPWIIADYYHNYFHLGD